MNATMPRKRLVTLAKLWLRESVHSLVAMPSVANHASGRRHRTRGPVKPCINKLARSDKWNPSPKPCSSRIMTTALTRPLGISAFNNVDKQLRNELLCVVGVLLCTVFPLPLPFSLFLSLWWNFGGVESPPLNVPIRALGLSCEALAASHDSSRTPNVHI